LKLKGSWTKTADMISVLILTKDEECNLPQCIETVRWSDDIHVLDSNSTDRTVAVAMQLGAKVWHREFDSFAQQQNWALNNIDFRHPWVFHLDADERVTPDLAKSVCSAVQESGEIVAFRIQRRDFFLGTWLKHVQATPFYVRLFRPEKMRYERIGHPVSVPQGPVAPLAGYLDHYPFSKGMAQWVDKHNFYSTQEAEQTLADRASQRPWSLRKCFFAETFEEKRRNQKQLFYRLPGRPLVKSLSLYFLKLGFLDGRAGFAYSVLMGFYEYLIILKTREFAAQKLDRPAAVQSDGASDPASSKVTRPISKMDGI
jgi:glycosyltransferase involved in cell wall biosynthesis